MMVSWEFSIPKMMTWSYFIQSINPKKKKKKKVSYNNGLMGTRPMPIKVTGFLCFKPKTKRQTQNSNPEIQRVREYSLPATPAASLQIVITEDETKRIIKKPSTPTLSMQSSNQTKIQLYIVTTTNQNKSINQKMHSSRIF